MEAKSLYEVLQGKRIVSAELGSTPGWVVHNFDPREFGAAEDTRVYLTVFVGGRKEQNLEDRQ